MIWIKISVAVPSNHNWIYFLPFYSVRNRFTFITFHSMQQLIFKKEEEEEEEAGALITYSSSVSVHYCVTWIHVGRTQAKRVFRPSLFAPRTLRLCRWLSLLRKKVKLNRLRLMLMMIVIMILSAHQCRMACVFPQATGIKIDISEIARSHCIAAKGILVLLKRSVLSVV